MARPLVPGEDAGRLLLFTGSANQVLTFLWLLVAVGWAAWRAWSQQGLWRFTLVEVGLLALAILSFFSAQDAAFKHPAWLLAWEWVGLFVAFCLVRQLVRSPREYRGLLSAVLATGVCLAAFAVYQKAAPPADAPAEDPILAAIFGTDAEPTPVEGATATFGKASTFLTYLRLLAPALLMALYLRFRRPLNLLAVAGAAVLLVFATPTTPMMEQWAWVAGSAALVATLGFVLQKRRVQGRQGDALALVTAAALVLGALALDPQQPWARLHSALGTGPGNFAREAVHLRPPVVFPLDGVPAHPLQAVAATTGLVALAVLLLALAVFFVLTRGAWWVVPPPEEPAAGEEPPRPSRASLADFYAGGILGLTLAVGLTLDPFGSDLLRAGAEAAGRSLVWFASFALLAGVPWTPRAVVASVAAGALLVLVLPGDILSPSVGLPLWVLLALALNVADAGGTWAPRHWLALALPMPLMAILAIAYVMVGLYPAVSSGMEIAAARRHYGQWRTEVEPEWKTRLKDAKTPEEKMAASVRANRYLSIAILRPVGQAVVADPGNPYPWTESAYWAARRWQLFAALKDSLNETWPSQQEDAWKKDLLQADAARAQAVAKVQECDPKGRTAAWSQYQSRAFVYAPQLVSLRRPLMSEDETQQLNKEIGITYERAARALNDLIKTEPTNPRYREWRTDYLEKALKLDGANPQAYHLLAEIAASEGDIRTAKEKAREALTLNEKEISSRRKLTDEQLRQIQTWLSAKPSG